jgi:hypothetical protein
MGQPRNILAIFYQYCLATNIVLLPILSCLWVFLRNILAIFSQYFSQYPGNILAIFWQCTLVQYFGNILAIVSCHNWQSPFNEYGVPRGVPYDVPWNTKDLSKSLEIAFFTIIPRQR